MSVINFILAPVLATVAVDQSCFYYVLQPNDPITSAVLVLNCQLILFFVADHVVPVCEYDYVTFTSSSTPAYHYSYACGSALLRAYVTVLIYSQLTFAFLIPAINMSKILFKGFFDEDKFLVKLLFQAFDIDIFMIRGTVVLFDMVIHSMVFLTFGLSSSTLGVMIGLGMVINACTHQLQVGRLLCLGYEQPTNTSSSDSPSFPTASSAVSSSILHEKHLQRLDIIDAWFVVPGSSNIVLVLVFWFWSFLFFDMIADGHGWVSGLSVSLSIAVLCPMLVLFGRQCISSIVSAVMTSMKIKDVSEDMDMRAGIGVDEDKLAVEIARINDSSEVPNHDAATVFNPVVTMEA
jgi:hypothetical protein